MSLVKWIRKNNRKIMVFVVIFSMVSFVVGYTGLQIIASIFDPNKQVAATYNGGKIRNADMFNAQQELNLLRGMMAEQLLTSQGLGGALMTHLLFPDSAFSREIPSQLKQAVQAGQVQISLDELEAYFNQPTPRPEEMWILLKAETRRAGYANTAQQAEQYFNEFIRMVVRSQASELTAEQLSQYAAQMYTQTISRIMTQANLTQEELFTIFADMLSVTQFTNAVMNNQAVTLTQVQSVIGRTQERLDAEYVRIDADLFVDPDQTVSDSRLLQQFEAFKSDYPNMPTEENPFGFGYRLPHRVQVEYMVVMMEDVESQIVTPDQEALENYYRNNIQYFQRQVPANPDTPQAEPATETRPFAEVELQIRRTLENDRAANFANMVFNEIKDKTETGFEQITFDEATVDQLQMAAGDYSAVAEAVSRVHNVPIRTGKTGWLSPADLAQDRILGTLSLPQQDRLRLTELLLSVSAAGTEPQRRIGMPTVRQWQNIGPMQGRFFSQEKQNSYQFMAMVRVVGVQPETIPASPDVQYDTTGVVVFDRPGARKSFSIKDKVKEDVRLLTAMDTAKDRAAELAAAAEATDWQQAIDSYNTKYVGSTDPNRLATDPNAVQITTVEQQMRASQAEIAYAKRYIQQNPIAAQFMRQSLIANILTSRLYDRLPEDAESTGTVHDVLVFEPHAAAYVVKSVTRQPPTMTDYLDSKAAAAMQLSMQEAASLALVHLNPKNIIERMKYEIKEDKPETPAPAEPAEETNEQTAD